MFIRLAREHRPEYRFDPEARDFAAWQEKKPLVLQALGRRPSRSRKCATDRGVDRIAASKRAICLMRVRIFPRRCR